MFKTEQNYSYQERLSITNEIERMLGIKNHPIDPNISFETRKLITKEIENALGITHFNRPLTHLPTYSHQSDAIEVARKKVEQLHAAQLEAVAELKAAQQDAINAAIQRDAIARQKAFEKEKEDLNAAQLEAATKLEAATRLDEAHQKDVIGQEVTQLNAAKKPLQPNFVEENCENVLLNYIQKKSEGDSLKYESDSDSDNSVP